MNNNHKAAYLVDENVNSHYINDKACYILDYTRDKPLHLKVPDIDPDFPITWWIDHRIDLKKERTPMATAQRVIHCHQRCRFTLHA